MICGQEKFCRKYGDKDYECNGEIYYNHDLKCYIPDKRDMVDCVVANSLTFQRKQTELLETIAIKLGANF